MRDPHREEVRSQHSFRALDDEPVLQWPYSPGYLYVRGATLALGCHPPLVKLEVGVASMRAVESLHIFDCAQERLGEILRMYALVQEGVPTILVLNGKWSATVRNGTDERPMDATS